MNVYTLLGFGGLACILASGVLWFRAALAVNLPQNRTVYIIVWLLATISAIAALSGPAGSLASIAAVLTLLGGAFFLMTVAISRQRVDASSIAVGSSLPVFSATDEAGTPFDSTALAGQPLLLKFFRGHW